jgi:hopanoid-associated phosphorylase
MDTQRGEPLTGGNAPWGGKAVLRPIGILVAVDTEHTILRKVMRAWSGLAPTIAVSGMGPEAAERTAETLAAGGVCGLMSFGYAGAIREDLKRGTVIIAEEVRTETGSAFATDPAWRLQLAEALAGQMGVRFGSLLSLRAVAASPAEKRRHAESSDAIAVDMESAAVAKVARRHGLPFIAIRAIVDEAHHCVPKAAAAAVDPHGRSRPWRAAMPLLKEPAQIGALVMLARGASAADRSLADICRLVGPGFGLV